MLLGYAVGATPTGQIGAWHDIEPLPRYRPDSFGWPTLSPADTTRKCECPDNQELDDYIQNTLPDKTVPLYRNQAKITFDGGDLFVVTGFAVCNGYAFGTVVPFNTETKKFDGAILPIICHCPMIAPSLQIRPR